MSDYERWTIYPLLLLILGIVLKDKLLKSVDAQNVVCRSLEVVDAQGKDLVRLGGGIEIFGASGKPVITLVPDPGGKKRGLILTKTDDGHPLVELVAHGDAGAIVVYDARGANIIGGPRGQVRFVPPPADARPQAAAGGGNRDRPPVGEQSQEKAPHDPQEKEKPAAQP
jgi:hypothetical protein